MKKPVQVPANAPAWKREIADAMNKLGLSMRPVSEAIGRNETFVRDILKRSGEPSYSNLKDLYQYLGISDDEKAYVPFYGKVSAGGLSPAGQSGVIDMFNIGTTPNSDCFILKVEGRSMLKIATEGSLIIVDPRQKQLVDEWFYIFGHEGMATFKRYKPNPHRLEPYTFDDGFEPIYPENEPLPVGRVIKVITDL